MASYVIGCRNDKQSCTTTGTDKPDSIGSFLTKTVEDFFDNTGQPKVSNYLGYSYDANGRLSKIGIESEPYTQSGVTIYDRNSKGRTIRIMKTSFFFATGDCVILTMKNGKIITSVVDENNYPFEFTGYLFLKESVIGSLALHMED